MPPSSHNPITDHVKKWVLKAIGNHATIQEISPLLGATSSALYQIRIQKDKANYSLVLRLFTNREWLTHHPDLAKHEAESLQLVQKLSISTPELVAYDESGEYGGYPAVLMSKCEGAINLHPINFFEWVAGMAHTLSQIHTLHNPSFEWTYFPYHEHESLIPPHWSSYQQEWERAIHYVSKRNPIENERYFIHRDYHPVNLLWKNNRISAVVDWVNACLGPRGIDVGHCRLNLALLYGTEVADQFLQSYLERNDSFQYDPYWDLKGLFDTLPGPPRVYEGWLDYQVKGLTSQLMIKRLDTYLISILRRI